MPSSKWLGLAMPLMHHPARATPRLPTALWHVRVDTNSLRSCPNLKTLLFPHGVMAVTGTYESVGDFVEKSVPNGGVVVPFNKVDREGDHLAVGKANAELPLRPVEGEGPAVKAMSRQQVQRQLFSSQKLGRKGHQWPS